ncbi:MAG: IS630 family transposase [Myxococcaceae bacterium]
MKIELTTIEKEELEIRHSKERDGRIRDRIKAVLLFAEGWSQRQIAQALRLHPETVHDHLEEYKQSKKLQPKNGGSLSHLTSHHRAELIKHLEAKTYLKVAQICAFVEKTFHVKFTVSGMTKWLHHAGFSYKKPKGTPAKADPQKQAEFIKHYETLLNTIGEDEPVEFGDGVHPTMATKITYGWIRTGKCNPIATQASRTRMNLMGSINLDTMAVTIGSYETIDSFTMESHFEKLKVKYPKAPKIHLILDRGPYNISVQTKEAALMYGIILHHLPSYSPNLNPIERLWKVMNEHTRNNRFFASAKEFRREIMNFFEVTWPKIALSQIDRINDNFETLKSVSSS